MFPYQLRNCYFKSAPESPPPAGIKLPTTNTLSEAAPPAESTIVPEIVCPAIESDSVCEGTVNENTALFTFDCARSMQ